MFPKIFITDRELALITALKLSFENPALLLCIWHIEKSVLAKTKKYFETNNDFQQFVRDWKTIMYAVDETIFEKLLAKSEMEYPAAAFQYLRETWIPHKEMFVAAWTKNYRHFGSTVTSRVEGMHSSLNRG